MNSVSFAAILTTLMGAVSVSASAATEDIVDTATAAGAFSTLLSALQAAGLVDTLRGPGPFTVFAPTNDAFKKLPAGTLETLLEPENKDRLREILTYHVVSGDVTAAPIKPSLAETLNGATVKISTRDGAVMVNLTKVVKADISASNGVIHGIDTVLLPESD